MKRCKFERTYEYRGREYCIEVFFVDSPVSDAMVHVKGLNFAGTNTYTGVKTSRLADLIKDIENQMQERIDNALDNHKTTREILLQNDFELVEESIIEE